MNAFDRKLRESNRTLTRSDLKTLQINLGRKCNQACSHCHVNAAPWRTEMMDRPTAERIGAWIRAHRPETVDLTGGAPELSEHFRYFVETSRACGLRVIDRNNLTILEEAGFEWLPEYLAGHEVEVIASLPCYSPENVNRQRGNGVFAKSVSGLRKLNAAGYGTQRALHLVYNPLGPRLPGPQEELEADYKEALERNYGIVFNRLYVITNQPIARFAEELISRNQWESYLELLAGHFNPSTVDGLMCRTTLSVGYQGEIYDCDFNQMLDMRLRGDRPGFLWDINPGWLKSRGIRTGLHCLACAAGSGSSCTGELAPD